MNEMEMKTALHELDRIQVIVNRHEGHMFSLRGWLFAALAGVVAAYYSRGLPASRVEFAFVVLALVVAFIYAELRHVILVDALVARAGAVEKMIVAARGTGASSLPQYDGPKVNEVCGIAVKERVFPKFDMTLVLNLYFYYALVAAALILVWMLPRSG
jgi:hypothetical protein